MKIIEKLISNINLPKQETTYVVGFDLLGSLHNLDCFKTTDITNFLLLTDKNIFSLYGKRLIASIKKTGKKVTLAVIPAGEQAKNLTTVSSVIETFLKNKVSRNSCLVTLGGGVITDIGGFIGSILLRGIKVIHLPSTLLAQIDAAIGGKSGVDLWIKGKMIKNMVGKIEQPLAVISDVNLLSSLPTKEITNGLGEMVKYWVGWGKPTKYQISLACPPGQAKIKYQKNNTALAKIIAECQRIKLDIIQQDPFDTLGLREKLNLGHTIGHAIESEAKGRISHGESVALGLVAICKISTMMGILSLKRSAEIIGRIKNLGLPAKVSGINPKNVLDLLVYDKKGGNFVPIKDIGSLVTGVKVDRDLVKNVLGEIIR